jgi:hypothetical protein
VSAVQGSSFDVRGSPPKCPGPWPATPTFHENRLDECTVAPARSDQHRPPPPSSAFLLPELARLLSGKPFGLAFLRFTERKSVRSWRIVAVFAFTCETWAFHAPQSSRHFTEERPSNPASGRCPCTFQRFSVSLVLPLAFCLLPPPFRFQDFSVSAFQLFPGPDFARTPNRHLFRNFVLTPTRVEPFF